MKKTYISENLKSIRKRKNLELQEISNEIGIAISTLNNIENGTTKQNNLDTIVKISQYFNVKVQDFVYKKL